METPESVIPGPAAAKSADPPANPINQFGQADGLSQPGLSQPTPFSGLTSSIEHLLMAIRRRGTLQQDIREHNEQVSELRIRMGALETGGAVLGQDAQEQEQVITAAKTAAHDAIEQL